MSATPEPGDLLAFISYRRDDSAGHAGRLYDDLAGMFSPEQLFFDVDAIPPGVDFAESISEAVGRCKALVALIGPRWITAATPDGKRRIDDPDDFVRLEIEAALKRDILVIPVLLQGTHMPKARDLPAGLKPLARRNALELRDASWRSDLDALAAGLDRLAARPSGQGLRGDSEVFWTSEPAEVELPYLGLRSYDEDDARFFFGRETEINELIERVRENRFLAVFGPSGSGKSSLVRAGLTRALRSGAIEGSGDWRIEVLRPGARPLEAIAAHLAQLNAHRTMTELVDALATDPRTLDFESARAVVGRSDGEKVVWIIDQAEEIFTLCRDEEERAAAIANLVRAGSGDGGSAIVVLAMRADFYQRCAAYPDLAAAISRSQYLVSALSEESLRRAIEEPAQLVGLRFEPGLVDIIVGDVLAQPGALPLLQHALFELYGRRRGLTLTLEGYQATGGVEGALAKRAETVYRDLGEAEQELVRRVMLRLTQPAEGMADTRRRSSLRDLPSGPGEAAPVRHVVDSLAAARLVTVGSEGDGGEPVVEIAHEALLRAWPRVREWIEQDREAIRVQRRIADATAEWQRLDKADDALLRGVRLAEATEWQARQPQLLNDSERAFVAASSAAAESENQALERRRRRTLSLATVLTLVFIFLTGLTFVAYRGSEDALVRARDAEATANTTIKELEAKQIELDRERQLAIGRALVASAQRTDIAVDTALLIALEARKRAGRDSSEALLERVLPLAPLVSAVPAHDPGELLLSSSADLRSAVYVTNTDGPTDVILRQVAPRADRNLGRWHSISNATVSPDGRRVVVSGRRDPGLFVDSHTELWSIDGMSMRDLGSNYFPKGFSEDGRRLVAESPGSQPGSAEYVVFDTDSGDVATRIEETQAYAVTAFNADGTLLAISGRLPNGASRLDVWDLTDGSVRRTEEFAVDRTWVAFSPDGERVAVRRLIPADVEPSSEAAIDVRRLDQGLTLERTFELGGVRDLFANAAFWPGGRSLLLSGRDEQFRLFFERVGLTGTKEFGFLARWDPNLGFGFNIGRNAGGEERIGLTASGLVVVWPGKSAFPSHLTLPGRDALNGVEVMAVGADAALIAVAQVTAAIDEPEVIENVQLVDPATGESSPISWVNNRTVTLSRDSRWLAAIDRTYGHVAVAALEGIHAGPPTHYGAGGFLLAPFLVTVAPDASTLLVADQGGDGRSWSLTLVDRESRRPLQSTSIGDEPFAIEYSPDGRVLAAATRPLPGGFSEPDLRTTIRLFDVESLKEVSSFGVHPGSVNRLAFDPSGRFVTSFDAEGGIVTWDVETGLPTAIANVPVIEQRRPDGSAAPARILPTADGASWVAVGSEIWTWDQGELAGPIERRACELAGRNLTQEEWLEFLPDEPYAVTCPEFPPG